tara:strand:+ start:62 stop:670 length:609 start_codon:yes stop_codon:yes gene_type:complete
MNVLDWILIAVFAITTFLGYKTGLVNALINAATIYAGLFFSGLFAGRVLVLFWDGVESEALSTAVGYVIIFVGVYLAGRILMSMTRKTLNLTIMGWANNAGGVVVGLVIGVLIAGALMTVTARYTYVIPADIGDQTAGGVQAMIENTARNYAEDGAREKLDAWLVESKVVPSLLSLRGFIIEFAPEDFGLALDILETRANDS